MSIPSRPSQVPSEAIWCEQDAEWVLGPRNANGEYHGDVHYWRPDGTLACICALSNGVPHGQSRRFHENGEVSAFSTFVEGQLDGEQIWQRCKEPTTEGVPTDVPTIWRVKVHHDHGTIVSYQYYLEDDTEVGYGGEALKDRPEAVPPEATQISTGWVSGNWNSIAQNHGETIHFDHDGTVISIQVFSNDQLHGLQKYFYEDGVRQLSIEYLNDKRDGFFEQYTRSGAISCRGVIRDGEWSGPLENFDHSGKLLESQTIEIPAGSAPPEGPAAQERKLFSACDWPLAENMADTKWSSAAMGWFIATGWGGTEYRDTLQARIARAIVRGVSRKNAPLADALQEVGLDNAPRLLTGARFDRLRKAIADVPEVNKVRMDYEFSIVGGVGTVAALRSGGLQAVQALRPMLSRGKMDLTSMGLQQLPDEICCLPGITEIDAANNTLFELPETLGSLPFLRKLKLSGNQISELPASMARLNEFHSLSLGDNGLKKLPDLITSLSELTSLSLGENELTELPNNFVKLSRLRELWLNRNPLMGLPTNFGELPNLRFLHCGDVPWATPPDCIWELKNLEKLWLASRSLTHLPVDVARLKKLKTLCIWYSNLKELPACLFGMTHLTEIRVRENPLPEGTIERLREALPNTTIY